MFLFPRLAIETLEPKRSSYRAGRRLLGGGGWVSEARLAPGEVEGAGGAGQAVGPGLNLQGA